jgi:hypothetical protein
MVAAVLLAAPTAARAQAQTADAQALRKEIEQLRQELQAVQKQYGDRLTALESKLGAAEGLPPAAAAASPDARPFRHNPPRLRPAPKVLADPAAPCRCMVPPPPSSKIFNPDMAVIGNFPRGSRPQSNQSFSRACRCRNPKSRCRPSSIPYARAGLLHRRSERKGVDLEEGFLTFPTLPGGLLVKVGKQKAAFGKVNTFHSHQISWTDRPLVVNNLLGGEEGNQRCRSLGCPADCESLVLSRSDRSGVPRRFGRSVPLEQALAT